MSDLLWHGVVVYAIVGLAIAAAALVNTAPEVVRANWGPHLRVWWVIVFAALAWPWVVWQTVRTMSRGD